MSLSRPATDRATKEQHSLARLVPVDLNHFWSCASQHPPSSTTSQACDVVGSLLRAICFKESYLRASMTFSGSFGLMDWTPAAMLKMTSTVFHNDQEGKLERIPQPLVLLKGDLSRQRLSPKYHRHGEVRMDLLIPQVRCRLRDEDVYLLLLPAKSSCQQRKAEALQSFGYVDLVPPPKLFHESILWPCIDGPHEHLLLYIDKPGIPHPSHELLTRV